MTPGFACPNLLSMDEQGTPRSAGDLGGHGLAGGDRWRRQTLLATATRFGRITAGQAWRWYLPASPTIKTAQNRLGELEARGLVVHVPLGRAEEGLYVPTPAGARLAGVGLSAPKPLSPANAGARARLGHDLTVAEAAHWIMAERAAAGATWRTERELLREQVLARPPQARRGGAGLGFRPDGALVLPDGDRLAVEVELHDKADRLGEKLAWYRDGRSGFAGVWWLTHRPAVRNALERALRAGGLPPEVAWVELLPREVRVWTD
jgi:hypothetical protein